MTINTPELKRPIISIVPAPDDPTKKVQISVPGQSAPFYFSSLELAIRSLRVFDFDQAFVNDNGSWYSIAWGAILSPWEGPDV